MPDHLLISARWGLIAGPLTLNRATPTWAIDDVTHYDPEQVAETLRSFPGVTVRAPTVPGWEGWEGFWREDNREIRLFDFELLDCDPPVWGSVRVELMCLCSDFLALVNHARKVHPAIWVYDDVASMLHTPDSFLSAE
jgi:hypothetical protein